MTFPEKTDPDVFKKIQDRDLEGLLAFRDSLINGHNRSSAGN